MVIEKEKELEKEATEFLRKNGFGWDGSREEEISKTIFLRPQTGIEKPLPYYK